MRQSYSNIRGSGKVDIDLSSFDTSVMFSTLNKSVKLVFEMLIVNTVAPIGNCMGFCKAVCFKVRQKISRINFLQKVYN